MGCLYKMSFENGKAYVGITSCPLKRRISLHKNHAKSGRPGALQNAIRKYGWANISIDLMFEGDDWEMLCLLETECIAGMGTKWPDGYNLTDGGEGAPGHKKTGEQLARMSVLRKGKMLGNQHAKGYKHSDEAKRRISEALRLRVRTEETARKIGQSKVGNTYNVGRQRSDETRANISAALKGNITVSEERRLAISAQFKDKPWSAARRAAFERSRLING